MHPLDVLASRVENAAGLYKFKGPHVITQAKWAISVASSVLLDSSASITRIGNATREVYRLAHSSPGRTVYKEYGLDVFDAIPCKELIESHPELKQQLDRMKKSNIEKRAADATSHENFLKAREATTEKKCVSFAPKGG